MSETSPEKKCTVCGKPVINIGNSIVHASGGTIEQKCSNCGWVGGQYQKFNQCPRCGDETQLSDDHKATI